MENCVARFTTRIETATAGVRRAGAAVPAQLTLADLPVGTRAVVVQVAAPGSAAAGATASDPLLLRRLGEIGFVPGEPLHLRHRGPGGREPLAVQIGETMFALRLPEARCIQVRIRTGAEDD